MLLSVVYDFPKTEDQRDLPYLEISHKISNADYNLDLIQNKMAEKAKLLKDLNICRRCISGTQTENAINK
jgi:hypothetical protein